MQKEFDLVIYGATGFTGRLAAQYMMTAGKCDTLRIAIAGRDTNKLLAVQQACEIKPTILIADSSQPDTIETMVQKTRVVLSFAGPYSLYGEPVIAACAKWGVDYLDITGETPFIHTMIQRYQEQAVATGARLIPFSGFDSIPADLTVYLALQAARNHSLQIDNICLYYQIKGGFNGGTLASALYISEYVDKKILYNSNNLIPDTSWPRASSSSLKIIYEPVLSRWTTPFFMASINKAVVRRSAWLRSQDGESRDIFQYDERLIMSKRSGYLKACLTMLFLAGFQFLSGNSIGRKLLKRLGPKPGEGPSAEVRKQGFFRGQLICRHQDICNLIVTMERNGDPGNEITIALACESSLLVVDNAFQTQRKGFITPSIAFGDKLITQLKNAGFRFSTEFK